MHGNQAHLPMGTPHHHNHTPRIGLGSSPVRTRPHRAEPQPCGSGPSRCGPRRCISRFSIRPPRWTVRACVRRFPRRRRKVPRASGGPSTDLAAREGGRARYQADRALCTAQGPATTCAVQGRPVDPPPDPTVAGAAVRPTSGDCAGEAGDDAGAAVEVGCVGGIGYRLGWEGSGDLIHGATSLVSSIILSPASSPLSSLLAPAKAVASSVSLLFCICYLELSIPNKGLPSQWCLASH